jgi:hypothetical protein
MATELYRPGTRSLAVRTATPQSVQQRYRFAAARKQLWDPQTRNFESMLILGQAVGNFAGTGVTPERAASAGIDAVFHWWCENGPRGTEFDKRQFAITLAVDAAENFGFDQGLVDSVMPGLMDHWESSRCRNGRFKQPVSYRPFSPQDDRVVSQRPLDVPKYRFS